MICVLIVFNVHLDSPWSIQGAKDSLEDALELQPITRKAKNLIMLLGDGMGVTTITAGRIYQGQHCMVTYSVICDYGETLFVHPFVPDSAGTGTAYLCGVKTNSGVLGLTAATQFAVCNTSYGNEVKSILHRAKEAGKSVGIVSTTRVQHASPGAAYAHSASRSWYSDSEMSSSNIRDGCKDISYQLVHNTDINVILGGGRVYMNPRGTPDPEYPTSTSNQHYSVVISLFLQNAKYVWNKSDFDAVDESTTDYLMGLFEPRDMNYELNRDPTTDPSLEEMTEKAIKILSKNKNGFFLFVEDEIDHGHHDGRAKQSLTEMLEFDKAVKKAGEMTSDSETLTVVTADHSHVFSFGGYTDRGTSILGLAPGRGSDAKPYTSLVYGNGPGFQLTNGTRPDITDVNTEANDYRQQAPVPLSSETHGGEDVAIMAKGPFAHLFHGVQEQSYIAHVMAYAACLEPYHACTFNSASFTLYSAPLLPLLTLWVLLMLLW
uniref:Alkaline phosphatase n=1 Tax=Leptobrachium leishanense TaxID=445787 RepID=A0A8C5Q7F1_9ANUR